jgi:hypothetical protein
MVGHITCRYATRMSYHVQAREVYQVFCTKKSPDRLADYVHMSTHLFTQTALFSFLFSLPWASFHGAREMPLVTPL